MFSQPQFQNATFEINSCPASNCDAHYDCIKYWWNWHEIYNDVGSIALFEYNCITEANACEGNKALYLYGGYPASMSYPTKATTFNPLKGAIPNHYYAINFSYMRILVPEGGGPQQIVVSGTNTVFEDGQANSSEELSRGEIIESGDYFQCKNTTRPLSSKVIDYDYLQIETPFNIIEGPEGPIFASNESAFTVDDLSLCHFLTVTQQEDCSDEACFYIDYNPGCLALNSVCPEGGAPALLGIDIIQNNIYIKSTDISISDLPGEICIPLQDGTYTFSLVLGDIIDPNDCTQELAQGYFRFDFDYEFRCEEIMVNAGQNETWTIANTGDNGYLVTGDITVKSGATLTIEEGVTLAFCKNASLIIEPNARVNLYGTLSACDREWRGVQVYGTNSGNTQSGFFSAYEMGRLYTYETALIEKATHAVDLFGPTAEHTGGILIADGSTFKNFHKTGIRINPFENHNPVTNNITSYRATFTACNFLIETDFKPTSFWKMVVLNGVRGVNFSGCHFENQQTETDLSLNYYGYGIHAVNSNFRTNLYCPTAVPDGESCPNSTPSKFTGLSTGVLVVNTMTEDKGFSIRNSEFRHCETGIYSFASSYGIITQNDFYLGNAHLFEGFNPAMFGVRLYGEQTGFFLEENNFQLDEPDDINSNNTIGSFCHDIGETNNYIRLNSYTGLRYGNLSNGKNFEDENTGLVYLCNTNDNDHTDDGSDFAVTDEGIRARQAFIKVDEFDFYEYNPAGNHFSQTTANNNSDFNNVGEHLTYYYSSHASSTSDEIPLFYSTTTIELEDRNSESECEKREAPGIVIDINDHIVKFGVHKTDWQTAKSTYLILLDGGDTEGLLQEIATATPGDATLYNDLMAYSPYLSKKSTEALANTAVFTGNYLFNILAANPSVRYSEGFYTNLLMGTAGLDFTQVLSLQNNQNVSNARTELELSIAYHRQEMDYHANLVIATTLDAEEITATDFVNNWYTFIENKTGDYKKVESLIQKGLYTDAQNLLASIPATYKLSSTALTRYNEYVALNNLMTNIHQSGHQLNDIPTAILDDVHTIYETATGIAKYKAAALYSAATDELFLEYDLPTSSFITIFLSGEEEVNKQSVVEGKTKKSTYTGAIKVFPNPSNDFVTFSNLGETTQLNITDITGRIVLQTKINETTYQWKASNVSNGIYFYTIYTDKAKITTGKIVVDK